jgi:hypothetical protein
MGLFPRIALPMLAVMNDPTAFFLVSTIVIVLGCLSVLLPVFLPKYWERNVEEPKGRKQTNLMRRANNQTKHTWRIPEPPKSSAMSSSELGIDSGNSNASGRGSGSGLSLFLASEPVAIKRTPRATQASKDKKKPVPASSNASEALAPVGAAGYKILQGPAKVAKAILRAPLSSSQGSINESVPSRLEALLEDDDEGNAANGGTCPSVECGKKGEEFLGQETAA